MHHGEEMTKLINIYSVEMSVAAGLNKIRQKIKNTVNFEKSSFPLNIDYNSNIIFISLVSHVRLVPITSTPVQMFWLVSASFDLATNKQKLNQFPQLGLTSSF